MKVFLDKVGGAIKKGAEAGTDATKVGVETGKDTVSLAKDSQAATDAQLKTAQEHLQQLKDNKDSLSLSDPKFDEKFAAAEKAVADNSVATVGASQNVDTFLKTDTIKNLDVKIHADSPLSEYTSKALGGDKWGYGTELDKLKELKKSLTDMGSGNTANVGSGAEAVTMSREELMTAITTSQEKVAAMTKPEVLNVEVMKHFRADLSDSFLSGSSLKELSVDLYGKDAGSNFDVLSKLFNSDKPGVTKLLDDATAKYLTGSIDKTAYGKLLQDVLKAHNAPVAAA